MTAPIILDDRQIELIESCAGRGLTLDDIAAIIKVNPRTLDRKLAEYPEVRAAYDRGRAIAKKLVVDKLFEQIMEGKTSAIIFYLKTQCGWRETDKPEAFAGNVTIYIPEKVKEVQG